MDRNEQIQQMRQLISQHDQAAWDKAWEQGLTPWDNGECQPALVEIVLSASTIQLPTTGRALVPGCGRGYDTIFIANQLGLETTGLDLSEHALNGARILYDAQKTPHSAKVSFISADFFAFSLPDHERFDLIYDYTFFCAIPPAKRADWGKQMTALTKPGSFLITLVYPIDGDREGGPPFSLKVEFYEEVLGSSWVKVVDRAPEKSIEHHVGRERIVVWQKQ